MNQLSIITHKYVLYTTIKSNAIHVTISLMREHSSIVDLELLKQSRAENRSMAILQLEDAQNMNGETIKNERETLRCAVLLACKESDTVTLGIMAESGGRAVRTLQAWVSALQIPRSVRRKNLLLEERIFYILTDSRLPDGWNLGMNEFIHSLTDSLSIYLSIYLSVCLVLNDSADFLKKQLRCTYLFLSTIPKSVLLAKSSFTSNL